MLRSLQLRIHTAVASGLRQTGQALNKLGASLEVHPYQEHLQPSVLKVPYKSKVPSVSATFVAPNAAVIGDVTIGPQSSVWYGAVIRGDVNKITIGEGTSIGDRAVVHTTGLRAKYPTVIGNRVTIGAGAIVHGCTLEDDSMVLDGAKVLDGAVVQKHAVVAAGSVVGQGKTVPSGQVWAGIPAAYVRDVSEAELVQIGSQASQTLTLAVAHAEENNKTWQQIEADLDVYEDKIRRNPHYFQPLSKEELEFREGYVNGQPYPGSIFDSELGVKGQK